MTTFRRPRTALVVLVLFVGLAILYQIWHWEVERVEVQPGKFLVRIHRWGKDLDENQIVAPDTSYKGVMLDVLPEGRHFLNPLFWSYEVHEMVNVPPGQCLVRTRQFGKPFSKQEVGSGDIILATENPKDLMDGQRGILAAVLPPGSYRINPYAYTFKAVPAVEIAIDEVGVRSLKVGKDPRGLAPDKARGDYVVPDGYRGVQQTIVPPGTHYINPYVETITPVEVRSHRVELADIEFPSRDGFIIKPFMVVEYAVVPSRAPELLIRLTDEGQMHQADRTPEEQQSNEILQKVILPHIRGYARIEGSNFDARDFILISAAPTDAADGAKVDTTKKVNNAREALQRALLEKVKPRCEELGVEVRAVTLADMRPPAELADQIAQRELARVEREKNIVQLGQYKAEQDLMAKKQLKKQAGEKVGAETRLVQAKTMAAQLLEVEESKLKQDLANAQVKLDAARQIAAASIAKGTAEADVIHLQNEAEVAGLRQAVTGFDSVDAFAQYHILQKLSPALSEIFVSDEGEFANIFSKYMKPKPETAKHDAPPAATPASESVTTGRQ